jgi:hypothetical protein
VKLRHNHNGFGLLEVLFATSIFILVVAGLVALSRLALRNALLSMHRAQAYNLAQDGLEAVRQIRDTNWIDTVTKEITVTAGKEWLAMVHDCKDPNKAGRPFAYAPVVPATNPTPIPSALPNPSYVLCFDTASDPSIGATPGPLNRFGLRQPNTAVTGTPDPDYEIKFNDPNAPKWFRRHIVFTPVNNTSGKGLALLAGNNENDPVQQALATEQRHFMKVTVTVSWQDFGKDWSVSSSTVLSNWRSQ